MRGRQVGFSLFAISVAFVLLILVGCRAPERPPEPPPAPSLEPSPTRALPTATPLAPVSPTPAPAPARVAATPPPPLSTATAVPGPRSAFSGVPLLAEVNGRRRPLLVKIDNQAQARPQSGLARADVVFEVMHEGGITRFAALYQGADADPIGPIRSARLVDMQLAPQFDGILVYIGASPPIMSLLRRADFPTLDQFFHDQAFYRTSDRPAPHNLYSDTRRLREHAARLRWDKEVHLAGYSFSTAAPTSGARPASYLLVDYSPWNRAEYRYDPDRQTYRRFTAGKPHVDRETGDQLLAYNVIVQVVPTRPAGFTEDVNGVPSLEIDTVGQGRAIVFRDGQAIEAQWSRQSVRELTRFTDTGGRPIAFRPGNLWVNLVAPSDRVDYY